MREISAIQLFAYLEKKILLVALSESANLVSKSKTI